MDEWTLVPLDVINTNEFEDEKYDDIPLISSNYDHILGFIRVGMYVYVQVYLFHNFC